MFFEVKEMKEERMTKKDKELIKKMMYKIEGVRICFYCRHFWSSQDGDDFECTLGEDLRRYRAPFGYSTCPHFERVERRVETMKERKNRRKRWLRWIKKT